MDAKNDDVNGLKNYMQILNHDLRSPLATLISLSDLLLEQDFSPTETQEFIGLINGAGKKMMHMIEGYLLLERMEHSQVKLEKSTFTILQVVDDIKKSFAELRSHGNISVSLKKQSSSLLNPNLLTREVFLNEHLFSSLLSNLLRNAIEASPDKSVTVCIYEEDFLCISFTNSGEISENIKDKLFQKFATSKVTGTGLGLYSAKLIIEAHDGKIDYESVPNGTKFIVSIPFA